MSADQFREAELFMSMVFPLALERHSGISSERT